LPDEAALDAAAGLLRACRSLVMASTDAAQVPLASYAPYVVAGAALHVFVSRLAAHSANLARCAGAHRPLSAMVIEDEARSPQPFARRRMVCECTVTAIPGEDPRRAEILDALEARFGAVVVTLRQLPDFELFRLAPRSAQLVQGFGQAFVLDESALRRVLERV
jgi:putative heme iron utilization protein